MAMQMAMETRMAGLVGVLRNALLGVGLLGAAHSASAVLIDFDTLADGTLVTTQFTSQGVTFSGTGTPIASTRFSTFYGPLASGTILRTGGGSPSVIDVIFGSAVSTVAGDIIFRDTGDVASLEIFDAASVLLGSVTSAPDTATRDEVTLSLSGAGIFSARFTFDATDAFVGIDNLVFVADTSPAPVPGPATLALLAAGLAALRIGRGRGALSAGAPLTCRLPARRQHP